MSKSVALLLFPSSDLILLFLSKWLTCKHNPNTGIIFKLFFCKYKHRVSAQNKPTRVFPGTRLSIKPAETLQFRERNVIFRLFFLAALCEEAKELPPRCLSFCWAVDPSTRYGTNFGFIVLGDFKGASLYVPKCAVPLPALVLFLAILYSPPSDISFARVHLKPKLEKLQFDTLYYSPTLELFLVPLLQVDRWWYLVSCQF